MLADPYRLIIDMPDVSFRLPKGAGQQGKGLIQAYRYGLFAPGKSRVVIDTTAPVKVEAAAMVARPGSSRAQLNVDMSVTDRASFVAALPPRRSRPRRPRSRVLPTARRAANLSSSSMPATAASTRVPPAAT